MRHRSHHLRMITVPAITGTALWGVLGWPLGWAGLGLIVAGCLIGWPLLFLVVMFLVPACFAALVPRRWRASYRHRRKLQGKSRSGEARTWVKRAVKTADRYRCAYCHSPLQPQVDHIMPYALGGLASLFNLMLLCELHNKIKSDYWADSDGYVHYHPWAGYDNIRLAAVILAAERRHRLNVFRWLRAAWMLG